MEIIFLGTASNNPTPTRGVSSLCFRFEGEVWMFDVGESTQIQIMKSHVKSGRIAKIFLTHLHGDHIFGLPGLLCTIGQNILDNKKPLEIYGPRGIRRYIRTCLELSRSMVTYKYVVHEMIPVEDQIPEDIKNWEIIETEDNHLHPSEILGNNILMNQNGFWNLFESELISVKSSWIQHRVPTFGFVIEQKPLCGKLDVEGLRKIGIMPGPIYSKIKAGEAVKLKDGTILDSRKYVGPSRSGKKITILGDCSGVSKNLIEIAKYSDVLIHESTLEDAFQEKAISFGHSTPSMASDVANSISAKCLILNHFSQRYKPLNYSKEELSNQNTESENEIEDSVEKLINQAKLTFNGEIYAAFDLFNYKI